MCIILPETDEEDERERIADIVETDTITIQVRDEDVDVIVEDEIEPSVNAIQINYDSFDNRDTPQAIMVATVVHPR
jgi:hypothetical protein